MDAHMTYTLPVVGVLFLIARPFISRSEIFKMTIISAFAVVYTIPWSNYIIHNGAVKFSPDSVLKFMWGPLFIEDFAFIIVQTVMTSLWTLMCVRWSYHACVNFNHDKHSYQLIRWIPIIIMGSLTVVGYGMAVPGQNTFNFGAILYWSCPVISILWYGVGNYFVKKIVSVSIAIVVPSLYLCRVDQILLNNKIRLVNEQTSLNGFAIGGLPLEHVLFLFVSNIIIVLAANSFDKARGLMETYTIEFPERFSVTWTFTRQLLVAFWTSEYLMPKEVTDDFKAMFDVFGSLSKTFVNSYLLFQSGMRLDIFIIYAYFRLTDNWVDGKLDYTTKIAKVKIMEQFTLELFSDRKSDFDVSSKPYVPKIDWKKYQSELNDLEMASFRALSRIAFYLPRKCFFELIEGFISDIERYKIINVKDLMHYDDLVGGSNAALLVYSMIYRCDDDTYDILGDHSHLVKKAYQLGRYVNISRDVVSDSEANGIVYVPTEFMDDEEEELSIMREKNARALGDEKLRKYISKLIRLSHDEYMESVDCIKQLPYEARSPTLAAVEMFVQGLQNAFRCTPPTAPRKPAAKGFDKFCIALYSLYIKSIPFLF